MKKTQEDKPTILDEGIIMQDPLCVNVARLGAYLLPPDEVIFFDWAVTKTVKVFNFQPFYYSQERIEEETRITRRPLERIIKRFSAFGILKTETRIKPDKIGRTRYFIIDFTEVVKRLPELIDQSHTHFEAMKFYFTSLSKFQKSQPKGNNKLSSKMVKYNANKVMEVLNKTYRERVEMYNRGELGKQDGFAPDYAITPVDFERSTTLDLKLNNLSKTYSLDTIRGAAIAFFDWYLCEERQRGKIKRCLDYFLTYDEYGGFTTFNSSLANFRKKYSYKND